MRVLSAAEALTPALERTKAILTPYSFRLWLKLGLVACLAEAGAQFVAPPASNFGHSGSAGSASGASSAATALSHNVVVTFAVFGLIVFLLGLALLYFGSRMQFVLMELVATRSTVVGQSWRKYSSRVWPWIGLKVVSYLVIFAAIAAVTALPLIHLFRSLPAGQQPPNAAFFGNFALIFGTILLAVFLLILTMWTLRDFVLPFLLFEDAKLGEAVRRTANLIGKAPGSVALYFILKFAFGLAISIATQLCLVLAVVVIALPGGLLAGVVWLGLRHTEAGGHLLMYTAFGIIGTVSFVVLIAVSICIVGASLIFYQAYALYFLGGHVPGLGELLEPPPPPFFGFPGALPL